MRLEQLIDLVRSSNPQVFMIGLYDTPEYELYAKSHKTVTVVGLREIDNPVVVFNRLAKESGAESFFPASEKDLKKALDRISALLKAQYTLAYYPENVDKVRKIEVKVEQKGVRISARRSVGSAASVETIHFAATGCQVSSYDHRYPWEARVTSASGAPMVYHEDFSDARSGWPNWFYESSHSRHITSREGMN